MATHLLARLDIPGEPVAAFALLSNPAYVEEVARATGGHDIEVSVTPDDQGGTTIVSIRSLPADLPSYAKALVGESVRLTETRVFGAAAEDGSRDGTLTVGFGTAPVAISGTLRFATDDTAAALGAGGAAGASSAVAIEMSIKASVPFVGGKIERFCGDQIARALAKEEHVAAQHTT